MTGAPLVTVLVPARNEEHDIGRCLAAIAAQDLPLDQIELIVVDGGSHDRTVDRVHEALAGVPVARYEVVENPVGTTPSNLNAGLGKARGELLVRVDARSIIPPHYVRDCVDVLTGRPDVAVVGGTQVAVARDDSALATGIARALNNRWGMGLSKYRRGAASGPADTVYLGAFRTAQVRELGGWDERFTTNQDFELNRRMSAVGLVWFDARLDVSYVPRRSMVDLFRQYHRFGQWKARYWRETGDAPRPRQLVLLAAPVVVAAGLLSLVWLPAAWRRAALAAGVAGVVALEATGPSGPPGSPAAHAMSPVASLVVAAGWSSGVWRGMARRHG